MHVKKWDNGMRNADVVNMIKRNLNGPPSYLLQLKGGGGGCGGRANGGGRGADNVRARSGRSLGRVSYLR